MTPQERMDAAVARVNAAENELIKMRGAKWDDAWLEKKKYLWSEIEESTVERDEAREALRIHETAIDAHSSIAGGAL